MGSWTDNDRPSNVLISKFGPLQTKPSLTSYSFGLSVTSSGLILPEPWAPILPKAAERPLKLLLPSLGVQDRLDDLLISFEELMLLSMSSGSEPSLATTKRAMMLLQNGQTGGFTEAVVGFGLLWQHRARVQ
uniref:Uncharacterized protein n=1 Tax=Opuntia streptacantha TaxID=393608 RepID=A0A7C9API8_OPUST